MKSNQPSKKPKRRNNFIRLSGIGIQMGVTVFLGAYLGKFLDQKFPSNKNWFTIGLTIFAVAISLYNILQQVNRINQEEDKNKNE
ncbi:MAG: AtpZ/AtpI family protein [Flavobacteriales bacterium]